MENPDEVLVAIADYVHGHFVPSKDALDTARWCLADSIGCAILALQFPECTKLLGPVVPGTTVPEGCRVPGTKFILDPIQAAFNIGTMIRWLDYNDTWLAAEWAHPSDNLGGLLSVADFISQKKKFLVEDLLKVMVQAYEIQGILALRNSFNRIGLDHVIFVKIATAAVVAKMLGGNQKQIMNAVSQAWMDLTSLRAYRHFPNTGSRKSWAAGDATSRGTLFAMMSLKNEMGYPHVLSAPKWGLQDVLFKGKSIELAQPFGSYVMENILFKIAFPAEFHAQTAVEAAFHLHPEVRNRFDKIEKIEIVTHESAIRIIDKSGPLKNPADRDHCLQYMVAVGLLHGKLTAESYEDDFASDKRIDLLREKMVIIEDKKYSEDYLHPNKRSIANAVQIYFNDGKKSEKVIVEFPLGHRQRRQEAIPLLIEKCKTNLLTHYSKHKVEELLALFQNKEKLLKTSVTDFISHFIANLQDSLVS